MIDQFLQLKIYDIYYRSAYVGARRKRSVEHIVMIILIIMIIALEIQLPRISKKIPVTRKKSSPAGDLYSKSIVATWIRVCVAG